MLIEVTGDILLSERPTQLRTASRLATTWIGAWRWRCGSAGQRWRRAFRHFCHVKHPHAGGAWTWKNSDGQYIVSLLTQEPAASEKQHPGAAHLEHVNHALRELRHVIEQEQIVSIALPRLATAGRSCARAGARRTRGGADRWFRWPLVRVSGRRSTRPPCARRRAASRPTFPRRPIRATCRCCRRTSSSRAPTPPTAHWCSSASA